jgi:hypothetical protein
MAAMGTNTTMAQISEKITWKAMKCFSSTTSLMTGPPDSLPCILIK